MSGAWGVHWDAGRPAMFHLMQLGQGWIRLPGQPPLPLAQGDVVLLKPGLADDILSSAVGRPRRSAYPLLLPTLLHVPASAPPHAETWLRCCASSPPKPPPAGLGVT
ncbi:MAG: cupin domain-containing protein [Chloroflexi bacterium]|nr:cupin domain-containing protein [Chloroflexota bacterium]